jgi:hypothetical protein
MRICPQGGGWGLGAAALHTGAFRQAALAAGRAHPYDGDVRLAQRAAVNRRRLQQLCNDGGAPLLWQLAQQVQDFLGHASGAQCRHCIVAARWHHERVRARRKNPI